MESGQFCLSLLWTPSLTPPGAVPPPPKGAVRGGGGILVLVRNLLPLGKQGSCREWHFFPPPPTPSDLGGNIGHLLSLGPLAHTNAISWSPATPMIQAIYSDPC